MNIDFSTIIGLLSIILGSGGLASFITLKYTKMQARGEARSAENQATKELQDIYQQMVEDVKTDREEKKQEIEYLKSDRNHYREERNEFRKLVEDLSEKVRALERDVTNNSRIVEKMVPLLCERNCNKRLYINLLDRHREKEKEKETEDTDDSEKTTQE